jgi:hypothetical protein
MAELKTKRNDASVEAFLDKVPNEAQRADARALVALMKRVTKHEPKMWGTAIIGFGSCRLKYASGRELDWFPVGFSPRKSELTLYGVLESAKGGEMLGKLGKHKTGKGCLYIRSLADVDQGVLAELVRNAAKKGPVIEC